MEPISDSKHKIKCSLIKNIQNNKVRGKYQEYKNTEAVAISGIELAKTQPDISGFIQSYLDKLVWNLYAMDRENHSKNGCGEKQTLFFRQVHKMSSIQTEISCLFAELPLAFYLENTNVWSWCPLDEPMSVSTVEN